MLAQSIPEVFAEDVQNLFTSGHANCFVSSCPARVEGSAGGWLRSEYWTGTAFAASVWSSLEKYGVSCCAASECTPGMFLWNVPQSKFSDCRLDIRRTSGESLQQHIKKQTTGGWCHLLKNGARCDLQKHMWHVLYLLILLLDRPGVMLCRKDWSTSFTWHKGPWKRHRPPRYMTARTVTPDRSGQVCLFPSDMPLILWLSLSQEVCDL